VTVGSPRPIIVLAPARSYSTVAVAMLAGHSAMFALPELLLFPTTRLGDARYTISAADPDVDKWDYMNYSGRLRAVAQLEFGAQTPECMASAQAWVAARSDWSTGRFARYLRRKIAPAVLVEKSPRTSSSADALTACNRTFPDARYVHLTRDPFEAIDSMCRRWAGRYSIAPTHPELRLRAATSWYWSHRRIADYLSVLPAARWVRVRGESLTGEPTRTLPELLTVLDVPYTDADIAGMMHPERWVFVGAGDLGELGGGDPHFLRSPTLRCAQPRGRQSELVGPPHSLLDPILALGRQFGYG